MTSRPKNGEYAFPCAVPGCKGGGVTQTGLSMHMTRSHKELNGHAPTEEELAAADEAMDRIVAASKILFPDADAAYRNARQIAEMQQLMMRALIQ